MKNIVICSDGTGNEYGDHNTNVVLIYTVASRTDSQITFYDPGVGTGGWEYDELKNTLQAKHDQTTGGGLQKNVEDAYCFLMQCFAEGDRVYLFGFSRGAFTVRSLAGMLHKCGLLERGNDNLLEYASKLYNTKGNDTIAQGFKDTFSRSCPVYFIGVWDTVESLAMNAKKKFHDARLNPEVRFAYQAISIDERRKDFKPSLWDDANIPQNQTMEQMWFAGVHSDVGGWYDERGLSNIALQWMLKKAKDSGMQVDEGAAAGYVADPHGEIHESYAGFWKIRGSYRRKIPEGALIHPSVVERTKKVSNKYAPKNLPANYHVVD